MKLALVLGAIMLAACAGSAGADGKLTISKSVADSFASYKAWLTSTGVGSYAITEDGQGGAGAGCPSEVCYAPSTARTKAVEACEKANPGRKCIVFAEGRDPVVEYQVGE